MRGGCQRGAPQQVSTIHGYCLSGEDDDARWERFSRYGASQSEGAGHATGRTLRNHLEPKRGTRVVYPAPAAQGTVFVGEGGKLRCPTIAVRSNIVCTRFPVPYAKIQTMKRTILICGVLGGVLIALLQWSEYQFLVIDHSVEIYAALVAAVFSGLGIWLGVRLTRPRVQPSTEPVAGPAPPVFAPDESRRDDLGITRREMKI